MALAPSSARPQAETLSAVEGAAERQNKSISARLSFGSGSHRAAMGRCVPWLKKPKPQERLTVLTKAQCPMRRSMAYL
jgi:hypothetical protein